MDISIFLAKAFSIYLLIISLSIFINVERFSDIVDNILDNPALLFLGSVIGLILGIVLVLNHNIWELDWRVAITMLAWFSLIKSTSNLLFPAYTTALFKNMMCREYSYYCSASMTFLLSIYMGYFGFIS